MAKTTRSYALLLTCCSVIIACHATRFVGVTCAEDGCALNAEPSALTCSVYERTAQVEIRDFPFEHSDLGLCTRSPMPPDEHGLVHCRMAWKFVGGASDESEPRCEDYEFLTPLDEDVFESDERGETCLVRQVTEAQAALGKSGWYYVSSAPQFCADGGPAAMVPTERPDYGGWQISAFLQCSAVQTLLSNGTVEDVDISECAAPRAKHVSDLGEKCSRNLRQADGFSTVSLELDPQQCEGGVCATLPLIEPICEDNGRGVQTCRSSISACSCRCAGEGDDPGPFCECLDSFECKPLLSSFTGSPETRGSYCVQKGLFP